jgi:hypothetical protein
VVRRFAPSKNVMPRPPLGFPAQVTVALRSTGCPVAAVEGDAWTVVPEDTAAGAAAAGEANATTASAAKVNVLQAFRFHQLCKATCSSVVKGFSPRNYDVKSTISKIPWSRHPPCARDFTRMGYERRR